MKIAYFDCFSGAAGDMIVAASVEAGVPADLLIQELSKLKLPENVEYKITKVMRAGIAATTFAPILHGDLPTHSHTRNHGRQCKNNRCDASGNKGNDKASPSIETVSEGLTADPAGVEDHHDGIAHNSRNLSDILNIVQNSDLKESVKKRASQIFQKLARAEAKLHGTSINEIHFHEVGGFDSIADVVGACIAFEFLQIDRFYCSPLVVGSGTVRCGHGVMPVPAPATAELIKGVDILPTDIRKELLTPTGAAILTTVAENFGAMPAMSISSIGYGAGTRDFKDSPNVLRLFVGEPAKSVRE
ncbi:MAG: LarC family nickel insertion protein [Deltaproteobacteria bacterium]|nr:LarC family nickel insertion protein [Deltaproteobacteria bacterium]